LPKQLRGKNRKPLSQKRPRSRTLTAVHEEMLADLVYPSDIIGRRLRMKLDGNRLQVVYLDKAKHTELDHKVDTLTAVYKRLTGKTIVVEFQEPI
jgi:small subunit ribosomal protein S7e